MVYFYLTEITNNSGHQLKLCYKDGSHTCKIAEATLGGLGVAVDDRYGGGDPESAIHDMRVQNGFSGICEDLLVPWVGEGFLEITLPGPSNSVLAVVRLCRGPRHFHGVLRNYLQLHTQGDFGFGYPQWEIAGSDQRHDVPIKEMDLGISYTLIWPHMTGRLSVNLLEDGLSTDAAGLAAAIHIDCSPMKFALVPAPGSQQFSPESKPQLSEVQTKIRYRDERTGAVFEHASEAYDHAHKFTLKNGRFFALRPMAGDQVYRWDGPGLKLAGHHGVVLGTSQEVGALLSPGKKHKGLQKLKELKGHLTTSKYARPLHAEVSHDVWDDIWIAHFSDDQYTFGADKKIEMCTLTQFAHPPGARTDPDLGKQELALHGVYLKILKEDVRLPRIEAVRRAMLSVGKGGYHAEENNSEHFAYFCTWGQPSMGWYTGSPQMYFQQAAKAGAIDVGIPTAGFLLGGPIGLLAGLGGVAATRGTTQYALGGKGYHESFRSNLKHRLFSRPDSAVAEGIPCVLCGLPAEARFGCAHCACPSCAFTYTKSEWDSFRATRVPMPQDDEEARLPEAWLPCPAEACWEKLDPGFLVRAAGAETPEDLACNSVAAQLKRTLKRLGFGEGSQEVMERVARKLKAKDSRDLEKGDFASVMKRLDSKHPALATELKTVLVKEKLEQIGLKPDTATEVAKTLTLDEVLMLQNADPNTLLDIAKRLQADNPEIVKQMKRDLLCDKAVGWGLKPPTAEALADAVEIDDLKELERTGVSALPPLLEKLQSLHPALAGNIKVDLVYARSRDLGLTEPTAQEMSRAVRLEELKALQSDGLSGLVAICNRLKTEEPRLLSDVKRDLLVEKLTGGGLTEKTAARFAEEVKPDDIEKLSGGDAAALLVIVKRLREEKPDLAECIKNELMVDKAQTLGLKLDTAEKLAAKVSLEDLDDLQQNGAEGLSSLARRISQEEMPLALEIARNLAEDKAKAVGVRDELAQRLGASLKESHVEAMLAPGADLVSLAKELVKDERELASEVCRDLVRSKSELMGVREDLALRLSEAIPEEKLQGLLENFGTDGLLEVAAELGQGPNKGLSAEIARDMVATKTRELGLRADLAERLSETVEEEALATFLKAPSFEALMAMMTKTAEENAQLVLEIAQDVVENVALGMGAATAVAKQLGQEITKADVDEMIKNGMYSGMSQCASRMSEEHPDIVLEVKRAAVKSNFLKWGFGIETAEAMADRIAGPANAVELARAAKEKEEREKQEAQEALEREARACGIRPSLWSYYPF